MATARWLFSVGLAWALVPGLALELLSAEEQKPAGSSIQATAVPRGPGGNVMIEGKAALGVPGAIPGMPAANGKPGEMPKPGVPGQPTANPQDAKAKETVKPIQRPSAPAASPNPGEFKVRPDETGKICLRFNGQPWQPVLEWLATISGMSLDWQELPGDCLNLTTRRGYTVPEVRDLINRLLLARGYTLLCRGEVMMVVEVKKIDPSLVPRVEPADLSNHYPYEFVKVSFPLVSLLAETVADELKPMISPNGHLNSLTETNRLEVMDAVTNLRDIAAVLKQQQSSENQPRSFHEFRLKHARADEVHRLLATLLGLELPKSPMAGGQPGMNPGQPMMMQPGNMPGQPMPNGNPGNPPRSKAVAVTMVVNEHNNSLLVQAGPDKMAVIAQVIDAVDIPVNRNDSLLVNLDRMQVYRLSGIEPEPVVKTLLEIGNLEPATRLEVDKKNSAIIAYASLADHVTIRALVDKLTGSERKFEVIPLRRLEADFVAGTIDFMMGSGGKKEKPRSNYFFNPFDSSSRDGAENSKQFRVDADVEHNRLLLWANPVELTTVEALLAKLGEVPASGGGPSKIRVIDGGDAKETQDLVERIRRAWPATAPNALLAPPAAPQLEEGKEPARPLPPLPKDSSTTSPSPRPLPNPAVGQAQATLFHLADMRREPVDSTPDDGTPANSTPAYGTPDNSTPGKQASDEPVRDNTRPAPPPVKIAVGPDGKLIVSSEDSLALDRLEELAAQLAPPHKDFRVFRLKYAWAVGVALNLEDFFKDEKKERRTMPWYYYGYDDSSQNDSQDDRRLSKRRKLKFISDADSNTILVEGASTEQLKTVEDLIKLYDQPPPSDAQSVRRTEVVRLKYSKAKAVADTVKDVYRDLLSANDKALSEGNQGRQSRNIVYNYGDSDSGEPKTPKFKGLLSIGVDEISNSLTISAPGYLYDHVTRLIKELDEAAAPTYTVQMVRVRPGISASRVKAILDEVYLQKSSEKPPGAERTGAKPAKKPAKGAARKRTQADSDDIEEIP
ncbi:MAG: secretin N-terminal domain-containing protein [Thermoguttaceae bacterium]